jgi:phage terminase large subunit-like protein
MSTKAPTPAYLTDKSGRIIETLMIYAKNPKDDVAAMNATARAAADGKVWWTLEPPLGYQEGVA